MMNGVHGEVWGSQKSVTGASEHLKLELPDAATDTENRRSRNDDPNHSTLKRREEPQPASLGGVFRRGFPRMFSFD